MVLPKSKILVVDDERNVLFTVTAILEQEGYDVDAAPSGADALEAIRHHQYDLVLTDLKMPGLDGLAILAEVRKLSPETVTVMMTGYGSLDTALEAVQLGAYEYLIKPTEVQDLKAAVRRSLERKRLSEIDTLYRVTHAITGATDVPMIEKEVCEAAKKVLAVCDASLVQVIDGLHIAPASLKAAMLSKRTLERLRLGEILTENNEVAELRRWSARNRVRSYALVPGLSGDALVCVLCVHNGETTYDFHASARRFLQSLARQSAMALSKASLFAQLQRNNQELAAANAKLLELDKLKSQFLSVATHELRTPLSIILGYNSMLAESLGDRLTAEERDTLREAVGSCKRLIRMVNSMLDITQIESGHMKMNLAPADLRRVSSQVVSLFQQQAKSKGISLGLEVPANLPVMMLDAERIEQVLVNLIGNALKFTSPGGSVKVSVRQTGVQAPIVVSVADTGIGISSQDKDRIFDEFSQVRRRAGKQPCEGSGLGLAIARRIVQAHQGTLSVASELGRGSVFSLHLPVKLLIGKSESSAVSAC